MAYLFDSNCFIRLAESRSLQRTVVLDAIRKLRSVGEVIYYTPQVLAEFWNVCTRPTQSRGGLGLSVVQTERKVRIVEKHFTLLPDSLAMFIQWRQLVSDHQIMGVQVHDAKLVASMLAGNISNLVTFNTKDFQRFPAISAINPKDV